MRSKRLLGVLGAVGTLAVLPAAADAQSRGTVTISGSTSVFPLMQPLARAYVRSEGRGTRFRIAQGGSDVGVADAAAGRVTLGMSSRDPRAGDPGGIVFSRIARDAVCVITNSANRVSNISQQQAQGLFGGTIRDFGAVGGSGGVDVVVRSAPSGTQDAFQSLFLGSTRPTSTAQTVASNGLVQQAVRSNPRAVGYVSLAFTRGVNVASYQGVACTLRNARSGQYPGTRNFFVVSRGRPRGAALAFYRWIRRDRDAQRIIADGYVPLR